MKPSPQQTQLLISREQRLAALRQISSARVAAALPERLDGPVGAAAWRHVCELIVQLELTTTSDGTSYSYTEVLRDRFYNGQGVSRATFFRARALAERLGLVIGEKRWGATCGQQQSNRWHVDWQLVSRLAGPLRLTETHGKKQGKLAAAAAISNPVETGGSQAETGGSQAETGGSQAETHALRNSNPLDKSLWSTVDGASHATRRATTDERRPATGRPPAAAAADAAAAPSHSPQRAADDLRPLGPVGPSDDAEQLARQVWRVLNRLGVRPRSGSDYSLIAKAACYAAAGPLSEHWLSDAMGGLAEFRPANPFSWLTTTLRNNAAAMHGYCFDSGLKACRLPRELMRDWATVEARDERLVAAGGPPA